MADPSPPPLPAPASRAELPPGGRTEWVQGADGAALRLMRWDGEANRARKGRILFAGGKRDFIERHFESYGRMLAAGYAVTALDWRAQGLSARGKGGTLALFDEMEADFAEILAAEADRTGEPLYLAAHSMGAHMVLRTLTARRSLQALVRRIALFAPMLGIARSGLPSGLTERLALLACRLGQGGKFAPGQIPYGPEYRSDGRRERLTGDRDRYDTGFDWIERTPALGADGASWAWVAAALKSCRALRQPGRLEGLEVPTLILQAELERVVDPAATIAACARIPKVRCETLAGGRHELQLERDEVQDRLWPIVWEFFA